MGAEQARGGRLCWGGGGGPRRRPPAPSLRHPWTLACHPPGRAPCPLRRLLFPPWNAPRPLAAALLLLFLRGLPRRSGELGGGVCPLEATVPRPGRPCARSAPQTPTDGPPRLPHRGEDEAPGAAHGLKRLKQEGDKMGACGGWGGLG